MTNFIAFSVRHRRHRKKLLKNVENILDRKNVNGILLLTGKFSKVDADLLREIGDKAKSMAECTVVALASVGEDENCQLVVMADEAAVKRGAKAGDIVKEAAALLGGRGGGRPNTAQGGGKNIERLDEALIKIESVLSRQVKA